MDWSDEFTRYVRAPHDAWPSEQPLQARKLEEFTARQAAVRGMTVTETVNGIVASAEKRAAGRPPTLFMINCGSSGSHWIEAMLSALPGIHACGEVYLPAPLSARLAAATDHDRACFLDALHQIHLEDPAKTVGDQDVMINSAHSWGPHDLMGASAKPVFLVRDPLDVVISRTFRKPKLRRHLVPTADDRQYLEQNITMVEKFYRSAMRRKPGHMIRYEDMRASPGESLASLVGALGIAPPTAALIEIGERYSAKGQQDAEQRLSNVYLGSMAVASPALHDHAAERLMQLRKDLGYT